MRFIVDTHILIWTMLDPEKLSENTLEAYENANEVQVGYQLKAGHLCVGWVSLPSIAK